MSNELVDGGKVALRSASGMSKLAAGIGRSIPRVFLALTRNPDEYDTYLRFLRASERLGISGDPGVLRSFLQELEALEAIAPKLQGVTPAERQEMLDALQRFRRSAVADTAATTGKTPTAITRPKAGTAAFEAAQSGTVAKVQRLGINRIREALADRTTAVKARIAEAFDMLTSVIGPSHTEGWDAAWAYLAKNGQGISEAEEAYAGLLARAQKGESVADELKSAAARRNGYRSKVKGTLGEAYATRCSELADLRDAFFELAQHRVDELNKLAKRSSSGRRWKVITAKGDIRIDGLEAWDEAVLIVEELRPGMTGLPKAELVMAAQYKVEKEVSALNQIRRDAGREAGDVTHAAHFSYPGEGGALLSYELLPSVPTRPAKRFLFHAAGEESILGRKVFEAGDIEAQAASFKASLDQFNAVADELLASAAEAFK